MKDVFCILDGSGSMLQQDKFKVSLRACIALDRASKLSSQDRGAYSDLPKFITMVWQDNQCPVKGFDFADYTLQGSADLKVLQDLITTGLNKRGQLDVVLFTDGCFFDTEAIEAFQQWLKTAAGLHLAIVGVGADQNVKLLSKLTTFSQVFKLSDIPSLLTALSGRPHSIQAGITAEIGEIFKVHESDIDDVDEEDDWI